MNPKSSRTTMQNNTKLALAGQQVDRCYNSVSPPIYQTSTFRFEDVGVTKGFDYTRSGNPTRKALEDILSDLEGGAGAVAVASGMAAVSVPLSLFVAGSHIVCSHDCYGGTERLLRHLADQNKLEVSFVDLTDPINLVDALQENTRAVWVETPSNPLLRIVDLSVLGAITEKKDILLIVDNTFLSPLLQQPFDFGADLVVYSTTKYINGHSDCIGGAVIAKTEKLNEEIQFAANCLGCTAQPFDSWLILRGLKTLPLRLKQHEENAIAVARFLDQHPEVEEVFYPGLESHPQHELAKTQQRGFGGMLSFSLRGDEAQRNHLLRSTKVFALAESLGGIESLIEQPATMSHSSMRPELREAAGITDSVIRLSVGVEDIEDLIEDLANSILATVPSEENLENVGVLESSLF